LSLDALLTLYSLHFNQFRLVFERILAVADSFGWALTRAELQRFLLPLLFFGELDLDFDLVCVLLLLLYLLQLFILEWA
jgi:hypothetical protein